MSGERVVVIIGSPTAEPDASGGHSASGLAVRVARGLVQRGERVELLGRVGADAVGDEAILSLARDGIGHVALLRDPSLVTPMSGVSSGISIDAGDVQLGLRYLTNFSTVLLIDPLDASVVQQVADDAAYVGAQMIVVAAGALAAEGALPLPVTGRGSPPSLLIPRPHAESPEFDALLIGLASSEGSAETGV